MIIFVQSILGLLILLFSLAGFSMVSNRKLNIPILYCPAFVIATIVSVLYIFGFFIKLNVATYLMTFIGIIFACYYFTKLKEIIYNKYFVIFLSFVFFYFFRTYFSYLSHVDDFNHWGLMTKEMFFYNDFLFKERKSVLAFVDYPPASAILQYYFIKHIGFREGSIIFAQIFAIITLFLPLFHLKKKRIDFKNITFYILLIFALISFIIPTRIPYLQVENLIGLSSAIFFISIFVLNGKQRCIFAGTMVFFISIIKPAAILLVAFSLIIFLLINFLNKKANIKNIILFSIFIAFISFLAKYSWEIYLGDIEKLWNAHEFSKEQQKEVIYSFIKHFLKFLIHKSVIISLIFVFFAIKLNSLKNTKEIFTKKQLIIIFIMFVLLFFAYSYGLLNLHLTIFGYEEAVVSASLKRYLKVIVVFMAMIYLYEMIKKIDINLLYNKKFKIFIFILLLIPFFQIIGNSKPILTIKSGTVRDDINKNYMYQLKQYNLNKTVIIWYDINHKYFCTNSRYIFAPYLSKKSYELCLLNFYKNTENYYKILEEYIDSNLDKNFFIPKKDNIFLEKIKENYILFQEEKNLFKINKKSKK